MKTFQDKSGILFAYDEDGSQDTLIALAKENKWKELTQDEIVRLHSPLKTAEQIISDLTESVQRHIDSVARSQGYDNIYTACTYAEEPCVPAFQAQGKALREWRSLTWARCHEVFGEVGAGTRDIPTDEELIALLPAFIAPAIPSA